MADDTANLSIAKEKSEDTIVTEEVGNATPKHPH